jgi:hypothetical protein
MDKRVVYTDKDPKEQVLVTLRLPAWVLQELSAEAVKSGHVFVTSGKPRMRQYLEEEVILKAAKVKSHG